MQKFNTHVFLLTALSFWTVLLAFNPTVLFSSEQFFTYSFTTLTQDDDRWDAWYDWDRQKEDEDDWTNKTEPTSTATNNINENTTPPENDREEKQQEEIFKRLQEELAKQEKNDVLNEQNNDKKDPDNTATEKDKVENDNTQSENESENDNDKKNEDNIDTSWAYQEDKKEDIFDENTYSEELRKNEQEQKEEEEWRIWTIREPTEKQMEQIKKQQQKEEERKKMELLTYEYLQTLDQEQYKSTEQIRDPWKRDEPVIYGCMNPDACNYSPRANKSDMSCIYCGPQQICTQQQTCCDDPDWNGICWDQRIHWCTNRRACNYNIYAQVDDWTCIAPLWCDQAWCPWDDWEPQNFDACWVCGWDAQSCLEDNNWSDEQQRVITEKETTDNQWPITNDEDLQQSKTLWLPFSLQLNSEQLVTFRRCLNREENQSICLQEIPNLSWTCQHTVSWIRTWTNITLQAIVDHPCIEEQISQPTQATKAIAVEEFTLSTDNRSPNIYVPTDPPREATFKHDELYISAYNTVDLRAILRVIIDAWVHIRTLQQPFFEVWIEHIYKLNIEIDNTLSIYEILQLIEEHKEKTDAETGVYSAPIFQITQHADSHSLEVPYYFDSLWRHDFIQTCAPMLHQERTIKVAIIDNAFYQAHEDLQKNVVYSFDVADNNTNTEPPQSRNRSWNHGTIAAWIIWWTADNDIWIIGASNDLVELYLLKATSDQANAEDITAWIEAIWKAISLWVDIINISRWAYIDHPIVRSVIQKAEDAWIIIIAAAGNYNSSKPFFPAAYSSVIAVWAIDKELQKAPFSNYWDRVNTYMYWESIASTDLNNEYWFFDWTSQASPLFAWILWLTMTYGIPFSDLFVTQTQERPFLSLNHLCDILNKSDKHETIETNEQWYEEHWSGSIEENPLDILQRNDDEKKQERDESIPESYEWRIQQLSNKAVSILTTILEYLKNLFKM